MADTRRYRVLVVEPSEVVLAGLRALLSDSEFEVIDGYSADNAEVAMGRITTLGADVVMINPMLFGCGGRTSLRAMYPHLQSVVLVALTYQLYGEDALRDYNECVTIYDSRVQICRKLRNAIATHSESESSDGYELSDRERDILISVAKGKTNKEIADECNISIHTVITHRKNITRKTGIKTIAGLTIYALLNNMITEVDME